MTYEEKCIKKAGEYASEASKYLTRLIGAENADGKPDTAKVTILGMIRSDIMNAQFGILHYKKLFMSKDKEAEDEE